MKLNKLIKAMLLCGVSASFLTAVPGYACTMLLVGKKASADGTAIVSRNEDFSGTAENAKQLKLYPAEIKKANSVYTAGNGLKIKFTTDTQMYAYSATPDAGSTSNTAYGYTIAGEFGEHGVNSQGVVISATTSLAVNTQANAADPMLNQTNENGELESKGIDEANVLFFTLPQAKTARHAVELIGAYIEEYGVGEQGNGFGIADENEVWYLETGSGHHWMAVKIPEDSYFIGANEHRIHGVDLTDTTNSLASKGIFEFVKQHGLLTESELDIKNFNFAKAFGKIADPYNQSRIYLGQNLLSGAKLEINEQGFAKQTALFNQPTKPISIQDIKNVLAATFEGTPYAGDDYLNIDTQKGYINIGRDVTLETHITQIRADMPQEFKALTWQAFGPSMHTPYMPIYFGALKAVPSEYADKAGTAWWAFKNLAYQAVKPIMKTVTDEVNKEQRQEVDKWQKQATFDKVHALKQELEQKMLKELTQTEAELKKMYIDNRTNAIAKASDFSQKNLSETLRAIQKFTAKQK